jgi:hypothetical protein
MAAKNFDCGKQAQFIGFGPDAERDVFEFEHGRAWLRPARGVAARLSANPENE